MKRIVICSDGTWNSPEEEQPTNVLILSRAIAPADGQGNRQVVFYDWGVGSDRKKLSGGITGAGIDKNIQDCYRFLVHNYEKGDQLFLFGFSRGAYTVRSLGGFIRNCGVLKREHANRIPKAYERYRKRTKGSHPDSFSSKNFRKRYAVSDRTPIEFVGVWDTVGSLGIPVTFWGLLDDDDEYLFHDTSPSSIIACARHALSIDENREDFEPTPWDHKEGIDLQQVWFAGVHSDVGGGYSDDHGLSDVSCRWMVQAATARGLRVEGHLRKQLDPDPLGEQHDERKRLFKLRGKLVRGISRDALVHASVKRRHEDLRGGYASKAFKRFFDSCDRDWSQVTLVS